MRDISCNKNKFASLQKRQVERTYENARIFGNRVYYIDSGKPKTKKATTSTTSTTTTSTTTKYTQRKKISRVFIDFNHITY